MKKLGVFICLLAVFLIVPPAKSALRTFIGFDMLRQLLILNRTEAGVGDTGKTNRHSPDSGDEGSGRERGGNAQQRGKAHFSTMLLVSEDQTAELSTEIGFADFTLEAAGGDTLILVEVDYDANKSQAPTMDYHRDDGHVVISLESTGSSQDRDSNIPGEAESTWHVRLGREVEWSLTLDLGYCNNSIELGGLKVEELSIESGLSETTLSFSEPNVTVLKKCNIESGLGSFEAMQLGNALMRDFYLENGLGSSTLDFTGRWSQEDLKATIESGMGSVKMRLPDGLPVMMQVDNTLGSADLPKFRRMDDGIYRSVSYIEGAPSLHADVSVGMGSVTVIWVTKERHLNP